MSTKTCPCCGAVKQLSEFQVRRASADGLTAACKACLSARDKRRANNPNRVAAREVYRKTEAFRVSHNAASKKYATATRVRRKAQVALNNAIRDGRLTKQPCHICGELEVEGHHPDYSAPLDVVWLCTKHHAQLHEKHREYERQLSMSNKPLTDQQIVVH